MNMEILENIAMDICQSKGVLSKRGKSYIIIETQSNDLRLLPLASPEALVIIQDAFKEREGTTGYNASVLTVLDLLYMESNKRKID